MVTAASEDARRDPADLADVLEWVDYFDLTHPVAVDPGATTDRLYDPAARTRPTYVLLGPGAEILSVGSTYDVATIEAHLPWP